MIPKIVHFIWIQGVSELPDKYRPNVEAWAKLHPTWTLKIWGLSELLLVAARAAPQYLETYNKYFANATKVNFALLSDVFRGMLLDLFGGIYSDLDYIPLRPFDSLADVSEPTVGKVDGGFVNNALIISPKGHRFWRRWFRTVRSNLRKYSWINGFYESLYVMAIAGPFMWSSIGATELEPGVLYHDFEVKMTAKRIDEVRQSTLSYGVHIGDGKWVSRKGLDGLVQDILVKNSRTLWTIPKAVGISVVVWLGLASKNPLAVCLCVAFAILAMTYRTRPSQTRVLLSAVDAAFSHGVAVGAGREAVPGSR